jgi:hypothetical protein
MLDMRFSVAVMESSIFWDTTCAVWWKSANTQEGHIAFFLGVKKKAKGTKAKLVGT